MHFSSRFILVLILSAVLSACASYGGYNEPRPIPPRPGDENVKVGKPYQIGGVWYYPREDRYYDVLGRASWYGHDFHGKRTANGEIFDMNALTAAHTTLPMPSYVRVTNLSNGRSLVLRVNDRGPFVKDRIIDLSRRAAQLLGFEKKGIEQVRVQVVQPDGRPYPQPVDGGLTPLPPRNPEDVIKETSLDNLPGDPQTQSAGANSGPLPDEVLMGWFFVQVGAFSSEQNAHSLIPRLNHIAPVFIEEALIENIRLYRVRLGAFENFGEAIQVLNAVKSLGFLDARIFTEPKG